MKIVIILSGFDAKDSIEKTNESTIIQKAEGEKPPSKPKDAFIDNIENAEKASNNLKMANNTEDVTLESISSVVELKPSETSSTEASAITPAITPNNSTKEQSGSEPSLPVLGKI